MKKIIFTAAIIALIIWALPAISEYFGTDTTDGNSVSVEIPAGATVDAIADILHESGIIESKTAFKLRVKLSGKGTSLNYGTYTLNDGMSVKDVISYLSDGGNQNTVSLVVPEGFSAENIADRAENLGLCSKKDFLMALNESYGYEFEKYIPQGEYKYRLQGFLFPDTYSFSEGTAASDVVKTMLDNFDAKYRERFGGYDEGVFERIVKASLIEKEARLAAERPTIAGVIENRLAIDMPLQLDAAIVYAVSGGTYDMTGVSYSHLEVDSPYNIYVNRGLPPGPICNPGMSAINAAASPRSHKYLYYHTDTAKNDGSHIFTETYDEHLSTQN